MNEMMKDHIKIIIELVEKLAGLVVAFYTAKDKDAYKEAVIISLFNAIKYYLNMMLVQLEQKEANDE